MKIFRINRLPQSWPDAASAALEAEGAPEPSVLPVSLMPDSSMVLKGNPVFLPAFATPEEWEMAVVPVVRIGRLGKFIAPRFAGRYVDAVAAGAVLIPKDRSYLQQSALWSCFDGALAVAPWQENPEIDSPLTLTAGDRELTLSADSLRTADTVALISRFATLRTGDIIIPCLTAFTLPAEIGFRTEIGLKEGPSGRLRIK